MSNLFFPHGKKYLQSWTGEIQYVVIFWVCLAFCRHSYHLSDYAVTQSIHHCMHLIPLFFWTIQFERYEMSYLQNLIVYNFTKIWSNGKTLNYQVQKLAKSVRTLPLSCIVVLHFHYPLWFHSNRQLIYLQQNGRLFQQLYTNEAAFIQIDGIWSLLHIQLLQTAFQENCTVKKFLLILFTLNFFT